MGKIMVIVFVVIVLVVVSSFVSVPKVGDVVVAKQQIQLTDGDSETCVLPKGEKVVISRVDYRSYGSTMTQKIYMVESTKYSTCWGFALSTLFK